jgi:hypothetical protein
MEGRARGAPFCKKIFCILFFSSSIERRDREERERAETLLQSELKHIVIRHSELIQRAVFPAHESLCVYE